MFEELEKFDLLEFFVNLQWLYWLVDKFYESSLCVKKEKKPISVQNEFPGAHADHSVYVHVLAKSSPEADVEGIGKKRDLRGCFELQVNFYYNYFCGDLGECDGTDCDIEDCRGILKRLEEICTSKLWKVKDTIKEVFSAEKSPFFHREIGDVHEDPARPAKRKINWHSSDKNGYGDERHIFVFSDNKFAVVRILACHQEWEEHVVSHVRIIAEFFKTTSEALIDVLVEFSEEDKKVDERARYTNWEVGKMALEELMAGKRTIETSQDMSVFLLKDVFGSDSRLSRVSKKQRHRE